jgi:hypothetical protein
MIYLENADLQGSRIRLKPVAAASWSHFVQRASTHVITDCEIFEGVDPGTMKDGADAAIFGTGNTIHLYGWHANWMGVADGNIFVTSTVDSTGHGLVQRSYLGFNAVGKTTSLARRFTGSVIHGDPAVTTAAAGDETLATYTFPGDIAFANTFQHRCTMVVRASGTFAANANAKTLKVKFGQSGSEATLSSNNVTGSPNGLAWWIETEITRMDYVSGWYYCSKMIVGSALQTIAAGYSTLNPASVTIKYLITGDAGANEIYLNTYRIEIF